VTTVRAPAKLTVSLHVVGRRPDGLHLIDAEMVTLDLCDELDIEEAETLDVTLPTWTAYESFPMEENIVHRALVAIGRTAHVTIRKRIPIGGGLGGGSADAAAILRWGGVRDLSVAAALGSDVPFCVVGGRARVGGVGEVVEPLPFVERDVPLFVSHGGVDTAACYRAYDQLGAPKAGAGRNDLRDAAFAVAPELEATAEWVDRTFGGPAELCGSGSTLFVDGWVGPGVRPDQVEAGTALSGTSGITSGPAGPVRIVHARTIPPMDG
jgi:4-diphosphocytidyl-2-C-methyl-D-erythritol kinase